MSHTIYPQLVLKRIKKDLTDLQKEPILNAAARPCSDDLTFWDAVIEVELTNIRQRDNGENQQSTVTSTKTEKAKLHFNIEFPADYPQSAPNIGFTVHFPYNLGASHTEKSGRLNGKMVICLDILGNFSKHHTEWKNEVGSGWTPAYSVSSLLINLQSILSEELDRSLNSHDKEKLFEQTEKFRKQRPGSFPPTATEEDVRLASMVAKFSPTLQELVNTLEISNSYTKIKALKEYLETVESNVPSGSETPDKVNKNIVCYVTGVDYTEDILGFGISIVRQGRQVNLSTPAELLSKTAFDNGIRKSSNKTQFEFFIPAFINPKHSAQNRTWVKVLLASLQEIGMKAYQRTDLSKCACEIFPRLINTLVLEMMKCPADVSTNPPEWDDRLPDHVNIKKIDEFEKAPADEIRMSKSPSIAYFEAICSFWRTYYWLNEEVLKSDLGKDAPAVVNNFAGDQGARSKEECADIGGLLASYTAIQHRTDCTREQFIDAYLDECFLRCVMWWKKEGDETKNRRLTDGKRREVFEATATSRNLTLFQLYFLKYIIGENPTETASVMDSTNGKAPTLLENFHKEWKHTKDKIIDWRSFFKRTGCSKEFKDMVTNDPQKWINECVERCYKRGEAYVYKSRKSKHHERDDKYSDHYEREKKYYR